MKSVLGVMTTLNDFGDQRLYPLWVTSLDAVTSLLMVQVIHAYSQFQYNIPPNHITTRLFILLSDLLEVTRYDKIILIKKFREKISPRWKIQYKYSEALDFLIASITDSMYQSIEENSKNFLGKIDNLKTHYIMKENSQEIFLTKLVRYFFLLF
jgi:hypothetical protein